MQCKADNKDHIIRSCGKISMFGSLLFFFVVLVLGLIQPGYDHFIDTISVLVLGKYGWVQQMNFVVLAISLGVLGLGLGLVFHHHWNNGTTIGFLFLSFCVFIVLFFKADPVDRTQIQLTSLHSQEGLIHLSITFVMVILIPLFLLDLIKKLHECHMTKWLARYTTWVIVFNLVFGLLWFYCRRNGIGFYIKGIWQKGLAVNVLFWMATMGKWLSRSRIE